MSKKTELQELYDQIELTNTDDRVMLGQLKRGELSEDEIDDFLGSVEEARGLDAVRNFENQLLVDFNDNVSELESMASDLLGVEPSEDDGIQAKELITNLDEIMEAIKVAYFQIRDYIEYEERLYNAKEEIQHIVPDVN